jgi:DNA topoisomerase-2
MYSHLHTIVARALCTPAAPQTKETLTTRPKDFGSSPVLSDRFLKEVCGCGIVDRVLSFARYKATAELQVRGGIAGQSGPHHGAGS